MRFLDYHVDGFSDELFGEDGRPRSSAKTLVRNIECLPDGELLYANPGYHRACQAIEPPAGGYLHTYAVDLGRSPDGRWWVLADRTQTPPGWGRDFMDVSPVRGVILGAGSHALKVAVDVVPLEADHD